MAGIIRRQASEPLPLMAAMGNNRTRPVPAEYLIPRLHLVTVYVLHAGGAGRPCGDVGTRGLGIWQDPSQYGRPAPGQYHLLGFPLPTALSNSTSPSNTTNSSAGGATLIRPPTEGPEDVGGRRRRARYEPDPPSRVSAAKKVTIEAEKLRDTYNSQEKEMPRACTRSSDHTGYSTLSRACRPRPAKWLSP